MSWAQYLSCVIRWSLLYVPVLCHKLVTVLCTCLVSSGGRIPDAAMIHAARKRRQMAREMGNDYIAIESNSNMKWVFHVILRKGINHWFGVWNLKLQVLRFSQLCKEGFHHWVFTSVSEECVGFCGPWRNIWNHLPRDAVSCPSGLESLKLTLWCQSLMPHCRCRRLEFKWGLQMEGH